MRRTLLILFLAMSAYLYGQSIQAVGDPFEVGGPLTFEWSGNAGNATDWIGVYAPGDIPDGNPPSFTWEYISGTSGVLVLNGNNQSAPLNAGTYVVHLFCCDGYQILATDTFDIIGEAPASLNLLSHAIIGKDSIEFEYSGGTNSPQDWIGIYSPTAVPGVDPSITYEYVPSKEGTRKIFLDTTLLSPGDYKAYFFCCDIYDTLAWTEFTIYEQTAPGLSFVESPVENVPIKFNYSGAPGYFTDWIGVYNAGDVPGSVGSISYVYVPTPYGEVEFPVIPELVPGSKYDAHLFCCDGYDIVASILNFSVSPNSTKDLKNENNLFHIKSNPVAAGDNITLVLNEGINGVVSVYNFLGQCISTNKINGENYFEISGLNKGNYLISLISDSNRQTLQVSVK